MRKFILLLLVPFFMVMAVFAGEMVYETESNYEDDDIVLEFIQSNDEYFQFKITNDTDDTIYIDFEKTFICDYAEGSATKLDESTAEYIFTVDDVYEDFDVIDEGEYLESPDYYLGAGEMVFLYIEIEVDGETYYWGTAIGNPE